MSLGAAGAKGLLKSVNSRDNTMVIWVIFARLKNE
jgi:hypothetical protein